MEWRIEIAIKQNYTLKELSPVQHQLEFEVEWQELTQFIPKALQWFRANITIKGFRKGKASDAAIKGHVGEKGINERAVDFLAAEAFEKAISEQDKQPIAPPQYDIEPLESGKPIKFTATYFIQPPTPEDVARMAASAGKDGILSPEDIFPDGPPGIQQSGPYPLSPETLKNLPASLGLNQFIPVPAKGMPVVDQFFKSETPANLKLPDPEEFARKPNIGPKLPRQIEDILKAEKEERKPKPETKEKGKETHQTDVSDVEEVV